MVRDMGHPDVNNGAMRLAAEADDRAAQLAFAIETIRDEVGQVLRELAELRAAVDDQRVALDELRTLES
jgi:hypothetical protein